MVSAAERKGTVGAVVVLVALALVPVVAHFAAQPFYITLISRMLVFALAAVGLNLALGFGGLVSFGHALYLGIGAYAVGILSFHGVTNGWVHLAVALGAGAAFAGLIGAVVVRVSGMTFIMITLAFAQMGYFLAVSLKQYGGDDGLTINARSALGLIDLSSNTQLYYGILASLVLVLIAAKRLTGARFGLALLGIKQNERRLLALGYPTFRYKLTAYVISALICTLAGFWLANLTKFAAPSYMAWTVSGELIVMAVLGGMGTVFGPVVGALALLSFEEFLSSWQPGIPVLDNLLSNHWLGLIGLAIFALALFARHGLFGYFVGQGKIAQSSPPSGGH